MYKVPERVNLAPGLPPWSVFHANMLSRVLPSLMALNLGTEGHAFRVAGGGCRHASRNSRVWAEEKAAYPDPVLKRMGRKDEFTEDPEMADPEEKVLALVREERRRQRAIKFHRIRKQLTTPGAPERRLTRDAMEQIRYLKQEFPEEWTVPRLAEGFSVSPDVIFRVLRSKFIPSPERQAKQDSKVLARMRQQTTLVGGPQGLPGGPAAVLPAGAGSALTTLGRQSLSPGLDIVETVPSSGSDRPVSLGPLLPQHSHSQHSHSVSPAVKAPQEEPHSESQATVAREEEEEDWDGQVLSDKEMEELAAVCTEQKGHVVQKGREFFDSEGNFLYRV
ncbi:neugrin [Megalops cyprinoides]|uniref:neugrin n=1 Tax=Megalops cyprinoides TaxID=118141 RepID=UPI001864EA96|nr:neugrin [Megalops cyprinoides]